MLVWNCGASCYTPSGMFYKSIPNDFLERGWGKKPLPSWSFLQCEGWEEKLLPLLPELSSSYAFKCHSYCVDLQNIRLWKINPDQKSFCTGCFDNLLQTCIPQVEQKTFIEAFFFSLFFSPWFISVSTHPVSCPHMVIQNTKNPTPKHFSLQFPLSTSKWFCNTSKVQTKEFHF